MGALGFPSGFLRSGVALATFIAWFEKVLIHSMVNIDRGGLSPRLVYLLRGLLLQVILCIQFSFFPLCLVFVNCINIVFNCIKFL